MTVDSKSKINKKILIFWDLISNVKEDINIKIGISTKIIYSTIIEIDKIINDKKEIEKIILINVPTEVYPEIRKIFIFVFEKCGFKDIKIGSSVDFQKLYDLKKIQ